MVEEMVPLFFATGHFNYTQYAMYYLHSMEVIPQDVRTKLMAGNHTMHHKRDQFNSIWSNMATEVIFIRLGHCKGESSASLNLKLPRYGHTALLRVTKYSKASVT